VAIRGPQPGPAHVDFSPDGRLLAAAVADGVLLRDVITGRESHLPLGPTSYVQFDPGGKGFYTYGEAGASFWPLRADESRPEPVLVLGPSHALYPPVTVGEAWASLGDGGRRLALHDKMGKGIVTLDVQNPDNFLVMKPKRSLFDVEHGGEIASLALSA